MSFILVSEGLRKSFGAVTAAADINLAFEREQPWHPHWPTSWKKRDA